MDRRSGGCVLPTPSLYHPTVGEEAARTHLSSAEERMLVGRRDFLRLTASAGAGTAIGGLVGLGGTLAPAVGRGHELRVQDAKTTPRTCPCRSVWCATLIY